jgi:hypothetical protein
LDPEQDTITQTFKEMNEIEMEKSGYGKEGIFKSLGLPLKVLKD